MQVTFYELTTTTLEKTLPKILEKVFESGLKALVCLDSTERLKSVDSSLWTYTTLGFLPHGSAFDPKEFHAHQPIWLTTGDDDPINANVLVVTSEEYASEVNYERLLDVYDGNSHQSIDMAKERMQKYQAAGNEITLWRQNLKGAWEKGH